MADYSSAADAAANAISGDGGPVEEYQYRNLRVRRGTQGEQTKNAFLLEGMAARRSAGGLFRLAKFQGPSE